MSYMRGHDNDTISNGIRRPTNFGSGCSPGGDGEYDLPRMDSIAQERALVSVDGPDALQIKRTVLAMPAQRLQAGCQKHLPTKARRGERL